MRPMADRSIQMFLMPEEIEGLVGSLLQTELLWVVADGWLRSDKAWVPARAVGQLPSLPERFRGHVLVCAGRPPSTAPRDRLAGQAVRLEVPAIADGVLQLAQHDTRTDQEDVLRIAERLFRRMRKASFRPVWGWRTDDPTTSHAYRNISITPGAEAWWRSGGALGQMGSDFVRFAPEPPLE
jgi:hypothetical protein